jgi:hypothetical protein
VHELNVYGTSGPPPTPPQAPSGLVTSGATASSLGLAWTASPTTGVTYTIYRSTTSGFTPGAGNQIAAGVNALTYADTNLAASTTYYYVVQAVNAGGASPSSNQATGTTLAGQTLTVLPRTGWIASATPVGDPAANAIDGVAGSRFATGTAQVPGQWFQVDMLAAKSFSRVVLDATGSAADYARGYQVFVSNDGAAWGTAVATGTGTGAVITVDFPAQTARFVRVVQTGTVTPNWWSIHEFNVWGGGQVTPPPSPPSGLTATAASGAAINLAWTASPTGGVTYTVFRSTTAGFAASAATQIATGVTGVTYTSTGLAASTTYYFLVQANNAGGASASSNQANATTQATPAPQPPTALAATAASSTAINLSWTASTTSGVTYTLFRSTTSGFAAGAANQIATGLTAVTYADSGLTPSTTYYYLARANNGGGASASSNQATATTQAGGGGPVVLSRTGWIATASATGGGDTPAKALDAAGGTRWSTGTAQAAGQWFTIDMGAAQTFDRIVVESGADYARGYQVFVSTDGAAWGTAVATGAGTAATTTINFPVQTAKRWLRIVQTSATPTNWWSIYELNVWNTNNGGLVTYPRTGWIITASATGGADVPANTIDGVAGSRWTSGAPQANGQWLQIDMGVAQSFAQVIMDSTASAADYARGYQVFASNDGATWGTAIATGTGTGPVITVSFAARTNRYIRIVQTGTSTSWWSINEIDVLH